MLQLHPLRVRFGSAEWDRVESIRFDFDAVRLVEDFSAGGPHPTLVDVPERRTTITLVRRIAAADLEPPALGAQAELRFTAAPASGDAGRRLVRCQAVVTAVRHSIPASAAGARDGPLRTITFCAVAAAPGDDPVTITAATPAD